MAKINKKVIESMPDFKLSDSNSNLKIFPDFLIVGPQRTGTTWLAHNIKNHPQIIFSQPKELFFFNSLPKSHPFYTSNDLTWYLKHFEQKWILKNYRDLFYKKIRGEGTASYAAMSKDSINNVVKLNPDIKVIVMARNPVKRAWAHAKKDLLNKSFMNDKLKKIEAVDDSVFENFFKSQYQVSCGTYSKIINNWQTSLKPGNLFVGFFDDLSIAPESLLLDVYSFLGVSDSKKYINDSYNEKISPTDKSEKRDLPEKFEKILNDLFLNELEFLEKKFNRHLHL